MVPNFSTQFGLTNPDISSVATGLSDIPEIDLNQFSKVSDGLAGIDKSTILEKAGSIAKVETPEEIKEVNGLTNESSNGKAGKHSVGVSLQYNLFPCDTLCHEFH